MIPPEVLATAETLNLCLPPPPDEERVIEARFAVFIGKHDHPARNVVQRVRIDPADVERVVEEVRALFRSRGKTAMTWEVGPSTRPADLAERLLALGMALDHEPEVAGMVLTRSIEARASSVEVRRVTSLADFCAHARIYHLCFDRGAPPPTDADLAVDFERRRGREPHLARYLALSSGAPIAAADAVLSEHAVVLCGGATLPDARGKGAYRALVEARFREAEARGTPVLVVQAGSMSRPILSRMGFEEVTRVRVLLDKLV